MKFPHERIKLHTCTIKILNDLYDEDMYDEGEMFLQFGFDVNDCTAEEFMELKEILETYMKDATFKGKEHFSEARFLGYERSHDYKKYQYDAKNIKDENDKKEYELYFAKKENVNAADFDAFIVRLRKNEDEESDEE
jgi:hypothetical protein